MNHLISCNVCGHDISFKATECPKCGEPKTYYTVFETVSKFAFVVVAIVCFVLMIYGIITLHFNSGSDFLGASIFMGISLSLVYIAGIK